ncbi:MAG: hypothetical protein Q4B43_11095 [Bacteroidota bacterium]|nr:hypothetical protein [Bacteroidota bacterium]
MKNILNLALVAVALLVVFSCGKNSDDTQTENARIVGTWKCVKIEYLKGGQVTVEGKGGDIECEKTIFTEKHRETYYFDKEAGGCYKLSALYSIEKDRLYIKENEGQHNCLLKFIDDDTFQMIWDRDEEQKHGIQIETYKRVK